VLVGEGRVPVRDWGCTHCRETAAEGSPVRFGGLADAGWAECSNALVSVLPEDFRLGVFLEMIEPKRRRLGLAC
jgi:hypothetical protein